MRRVLIVTDHGIFAEALQEFLTLRGYEVESALDMAEALARASTLHPEAVFIDADMGKHEPSGFDVARGLRAVLGREVFLVLHTGYCLREVRDEGRAAGFDAYLGKVAPPEEYVRLLTDRREKEPLWEESTEGG
jgi:CheY-like chemotaxis protein